jgi:hypothetical protein
MKNSGQKSKRPALRSGARRSERRADETADGDDLERLMLARSPRFQAMPERSRRSIKKGEGLSENAFWEAVRKRAKERKAAAAKVRRTKR